MKELTQKVLKELLHYNPDTGVFTWKARGEKWLKSKYAIKTWNTRFAGKETIGSDGVGYARIRVLGADYGAHRLAWLYATSKMPKGQIDHINRNRKDNRIANLRQSTCTQNHANANIFSNNTTGFKGVRANKKTSGWCAYITSKGISYYLGRYSSKIEAAKAYDKKAIELHGEYAATNEMLGLI